MNLFKQIQEWADSNFRIKYLMQPIDSNLPEKLYLVIKDGRVQFTAWVNLQDVEELNGCKFFEIPALDSEDFTKFELDDAIEKGRQVFDTYVTRFFQKNLNDEITKRNEATLAAAIELARCYLLQGQDIDTVIDMIDGEYDMTDTELDSIYAELESA